jgi:ABC-type polysaccharide/polyol phosphate transport system ATPase subunit
MSRSGALAAHRLWKRFRPDVHNWRLSTRLKRLPSRLHRPRASWFWALRDVDFVIEPGEAIGLVGANGSGKSTLLKILNRVIYPYAGGVEAIGRIGALIDVTTGLHPELTGRENVGLYGSLLGLKRRDVASRFDSIVQFAQLEPAIDRQLKFYSSGMRMRLGFAVAAFLEPDILLVDEVLAVGDASFQQQCLERMSDVHAQGTTLVFVSHDLATVEAQCTRAIWLQDGVLRGDGGVREVVGSYRQSVEEQTAFTFRDTLVDVVETVARGVDDGPPMSGGPLEVALTLSSPIEHHTQVHLGISQGTATPIVLVSHQCVLEQGKTNLTCRIPFLPLPRGRYYVWLSVTQRNIQFLPWSPVLAMDVVGADMGPGPRGVVRLAPVYVDAKWETC